MTAVDMWGLSHGVDAQPAAWLAWFHEAEAEYEASVEHTLAVWIDNGMCGEYLAAVERRLRAFWRYQAALQAYNGYMEDRARRHVA